MPKAVTLTLTNLFTLKVRWSCSHSFFTTSETAFLLGSLSWSSSVMKVLIVDLQLKSTFSKNVSEMMEEAHS